MSAPVMPTAPTAPEAQPSPETRPSPAAPAAGRPAAATRRPWAWPAAIVAIALLAGVVIAVLGSPTAPAGYLSPQSTAAFGGRAIADIMAARGHPVQQVSTVPAAVRAARPGRTLVITSPGLLTAAQLRALGQTRAGLVLVGPDAAALRVLAPGLRTDGVSPPVTLVPDCALPAATLAGPATMGGTGLLVTGPGSGSVAQCYPDGSPTLVQLTSGGRLITVLGTGAPLTNTRLAHQGNAALAINLLSAGGRLIWLVPQPGPGAGAAGAGQRSLLSLVPLGAWLVAMQLGVALLLAALWRTRRLGPLITEPLPVVVRASETVEGHGRLYRSRQARDRVAAALRGTAAARLLPAAGLPATATPDAVTAALAARSRLDEPAVARLLYGPVPGSDPELIELASDLDALEGEVLRQ